ncbi:MAG: hypothetical protein A3A73_04555 [Omnitrophica bacterium RIFCSPLOWO2_01_FULL_50_24]|nr:MAG: hypothetical protein A3A73_04555 [Omnitrophica bacterium RIFCSPLOWO2_01_FULL_50_24]
MFDDELTITVQAGPGGNGCDSYRRRADRKRVPDGGDGGSGGSVILKVDPQTGSLSGLKSKRVFEAQRGSHGMGGNRYGRNGKDAIVKVPCGTTVFNKRDQLLVRDLVTPNEEVAVVRGGKGGYGNHRGLPITKGEVVAPLELFLSFKIISDICLVGVPNSGKTALLKRLTGAGVTQTDYPFATKTPQLGTYQDDRSAYHICDLPSIYGASSEGRGLGTYYLKHLERTRLIFFVLDTECKFVSDIQSGFEMLLKTVGEVNAQALARPRLVVVNKVDLLQKRRLEKKLLPKGEKVFLVSVLKGDGLDRLMEAAKTELEGSHVTSVQ